MSTYLLIQQISETVHMAGYEIDRYLQGTNSKRANTKKSYTALRMIRTI